MKFVLPSPYIKIMQTQLFDTTQTDSLLNVLPKDGRVNYFPGIFDEASCADSFNKMRASLRWQPDQVYLFGKIITTKREVAWVGDMGCSYTYSGVQKHPQAWTPELLLIKCKIESLAEFEFNSCLLNYYHSGSEGMGWHSDDEIELDSKAPIASLSLGGVRKFAFKHKVDKMTTPLFLENGSALIMHSPTQKHWNHGLLKTKLIVAPRINLTFRKINLGYEIAN